MNQDTYKFLKSLINELADGIELKIHNVPKIRTVEDRTFCCVYKYSNNHYIQLNEWEIFNRLEDVDAKGFDRRYILLFAILHEIAHYKQFKRFVKADKRKAYFSITYEEHKKFEKIADRYAQFCGKILLKNKNNSSIKLDSGPPNMLYL